MQRFIVWCLVNYKELKNLAIKTAEKAGEYLIEHKLSDKNIFKEEGRDIKLEIDRAAERMIRSHLKPSGIEVLGEEYGGDRANKLNWIVDPLDGTANYFRGLDQCCVSIALMQNDEALLVIYNFNTKEMFHGQKDQGHF